MAIMIDIETLGHKPTSTIISIAAIRFDSTTLEILETFQTNPAWEDGQQNRTIDASTVKWWLTRPEQLPNSSQEDLSTCLHALSNFIKQRDNESIWCNGSSFDFPILANAFEQTGRETPWKFWQERDLRTIKHLLSKKKVKAPKKDESKAHNALYDCEYQISILKAYMQSK